MQKTIERYGIGIVIGSVVTVGLLYLMQAVISSDKNPLNEATDFRPIDFVRLLDDVEPETIDRDVKPPPPPDQVPPDLPQIDMDLGSNDGWGVGIDVASVDVNPDLDISGYNQDGEYLPLVKVNPIYPNRALQRGIEGYVEVKFTVTETGTVEDPVVTKAEPPGMFERAALQAVLKFKYRPKVVDGEPIRVLDVPHRITFEIEDE